MRYTFTRKVQLSGSQRGNGRLRPPRGKFDRARFLCRMDSDMSQIKFSLISLIPHDSITPYWTRLSRVSLRNDATRRPSQGSLRYHGRPLSLLLPEFRRPWKRHLETDRPHRYGPDRPKRMLRCRTCKAPILQKKAEGDAPSSTPGSPPRRSNRSWSTSPRGAGSARPVGSAGSPPIPSPATAASPASTPGPPTTGSWRFPRTTEAQFDEKWAFVYSRRAGFATAPTRPTTTRRLLGPRRVRPGATWSSPSCPGPGPSRTPRPGRGVPPRRTGGRLMRLMTSDDYPA